MSKPSPHDYQMFPPDHTSNGFYVEPGAVAQLGSQIKRAGGHTAGLAAEVNGMQMIDWVEGGGLATWLDATRTMAPGNVVFSELLKPALANLNKLQEIGVENTEKGSSLATASGTALRSVAAYYQKTDHVHATEFDQSYPDKHSPIPVPDEDVVSDVARNGSEPFTDVVDPTDERNRYHRAPDMVEPGSPEWETQYGHKAAIEAEEILGKASVTGTVREIATMVLGSDPFESLAAFLSGTLGYQALDEQALAFRHGSRVFRGVKKNVDQGRHEIQGLWTGHAADEALSWLSRYSRCCGAHADFLENASRKIMNLARSLYNSLQVINRCIDTLIESILNFGLTAEISAGIGDIFRGENPLHVVASIIGNHTELTKAIGLAHDAVRTFDSMTELVEAAKPVTASDWPKKPYDVPAGME